MFGSSGKKIQLGESDVGLVGILDVIKSSKFETVIVHGSDSEVEKLMEMLRLEVEIWENFIGQVNGYREIQRKKYQSMVRSVIFQHLLKMMPRLKGKKKKLLYVGNFLHNLCIRNDELVKLILNQGFDVELIKFAVQFIDWFHVCLVYCD